ncbi:MAG: 3-hydroxyacyl-CoA dehydrogenase family protein [Deltaproteobacteria bacterium]|nr:3-hydroxyacyl-CoA dehydrogenase family protein [Deltaproteobacteria bacterium]
MGEVSFGRVAVLGAGTMGQGIAQVCASSGARVALQDVSPEALARARSAVEAGLARLVAKAKLSAQAREEALERLVTVTSLEAAVEGADAVVEAVPESMDLKRKVFQAVDLAAPEGCLLGSNTSSLSVTELAGALRDPSRLVGLHFFNPVPVMELLEIVRGIRTTDHTTLRARTFAHFLGKTSIEVRDYPGFATSRLGVLLGAEAIRMLESGVASAEDIDRAMELGYRHPMGPLRLTDLVGLDVRLSILEHLHRELGEQFRPPALLRQMVRAGKLGKKTGEGFYRWP